MWKRVLPKAQTGQIALSINNDVLFGGFKRIPAPTSAAVSSFCKYNPLPQKITHLDIKNRLIHVPGDRHYLRHSERSSRIPWLYTHGLFHLGIFLTPSQKIHLHLKQRYRGNGTNITSIEKSKKCSRSKNDEERTQHPKRATRTRTSSSKDKHKQHNPGRRSPAIHEIVADMGITLKECSRDLIEMCKTSRGIELNKRQTLKPWIMALLVHRYDRGIRDIDELNTDSVYYDGGKSLGFETKAALMKPPIDLRHVLTPHPSEIDGFDRSLSTKNTAAAVASQKTSATPSREEISEILRHEKLALLAKEARRILIDREIPFRDLTGFENEARVRRMSKQDPSVFLSLFSRAFCISERRRKSTKKQSNNLLTGSAGGKFMVARNHTDFSHRRFQPPSLKVASYKKKLQKKLEREARKRETTRRSKDHASRHHRNAPALLKEKMKAMSQRNR